MTISIGVVGHGNFGHHLVNDLLPKFAPDANVKIFVPGCAGERFAPIQEVAASDVVFLAVPISLYSKAIDQISLHLGKKTILVDIASVKGYTSALVRERVGAEHRFICTHPMFGPESFRKRSGDVAGFRVVITDTNLSDGYRDRVINLLKGFGFDVVRMTADEHDQHLARTLFLTHYVGQITHRAGFDRTPIDTVSFGFFMDAVDSVKYDEALFKDVYRFAKGACDRVLREFDDARADVLAELRGVLAAA